MGDGASPAAVGVPVAEYGVPEEPRLPVRARPDVRTSVAATGVTMGGIDTLVDGFARFVPCERGPAPTPSPASSVAITMDACGTAGTGTANSHEEAGEGVEIFEGQRQGVQDECSTHYRVSVNAMETCTGIVHKRIIMYTNCGKHVEGEAALRHG